MKRRGLLHSSLLMVAARVLSAAGSFLLFWIISQDNATQLGAFRTIFVFFLVCDFLPLLGMNQYIIREISLHHHHGREIFLSGIFFAGLTCLLIIFGLITTAYYGQYSQNVISGIYIVAWSIPATAIVLCCQSVLVGTGAGASFGLLQGGEVIIRTLIGGSLFVFNSDILTIFYCFTIIRWLSLIPYLHKTKLLLSQGKWGFQKKFITNFLNHVPSFSGILFLFLILRFAPQLMVPWMCGDLGAGYFALTYQFLDLLLLVPTALTINLMPILAIRAQQSTQHLATSSVQTLKLLTFLLFPVILFIGIKAKPILLLIFGPEYEPAALLLSITICTSLIMAWDQVFSTAMVAAKKQTTDLLTLAIASGGMLVMLFTLIPRYGVLGAAIAFTAGSTLLILTRFVLFYITIAPINLFGALWRYLLTGTLMAVVLVLTNQNLFISALLAIGLYGGGLFLLGGFARSEIATLVTILKRPETNKEVTA